MQCDRCHKKEAVIHYAEVIKNKVKKLHLCEDCALNEGIGVNPPFSIGELMGGLTNHKIDVGAAEKITCPICGMTFNKFKQTGRLGCYQCYQAFSAALHPLLGSIHKSSKHVGKIPKGAEKSMDTAIKIRRLQLKLHEAVKREEFESAAKIRDQVRALEKKEKAKSKQQKPRSRNKDVKYGK